MKSLRIYFSSLFILSILFFAGCNKTPATITTIDLPGDWIQTNGPGNGIIGCVAGNADIMLAGVDLRGMYFSGDAGKSWLCDTSAIPNNSTPTAIVIVNDTTVYSASDQLYRSYSKGKKWKAIASLSPSTVSLAVSGNLIVTGSSGTGGVSVSVNGGSSWSSFTPASGSYRNSVAVLEQEIFDGTSGAGIFLSNDYGQHWTTVNNGLGNLEVHCLVTGGSSLYAGTASGLYTSADKGLHWSLLTNGLPANFPVSCIAFSGSSMLAGSKNGILRSPDKGVSWASATGNLPITDIRSLAISGSVFIAGTSSGLFISSNLGQSWTLRGMPVSNVSSMCNNPTGVVASADWSFPGVYNTADHGASWTLLNAGLQLKTISCLSYSAGILAAGTDSGVFVKQDQEKTWSRRSDGLTSTDIRSLGMRGSNWFAGTYKGGFFRSDDAGLSWHKLNIGLADNVYVCSIFCHGLSVFAGTFNGGLLVSRDAGLTWAINPQLPGNTVISSFAASGNTIYAGTFNGVYKSDDDGQTWAATTLVNQIINGMLIVDNYVFAAAKTWGMFGTTLNGSKWLTLCTGLPYQTTLNCIATDGTLLFGGTQGLGIWTHRIK